MRSVATITAPGSDINNPGVVKEAVYDSMCNGGISQRIAPLLKANAGGDDDGEVVVTGAYQVKQQAGILIFSANIVEVVDDQKIDTGELGNDFIGGIIGQGGIEDRQ